MQKHHFTLGALLTVLGLLAFGAGCSKSDDTPITTSNANTSNLNQPTNSVTTGSFQTGN